MSEDIQNKSKAIQVKNGAAMTKNGYQFTEIPLPLISKITGVSEEEVEKDPGKFRVTFSHEFPMFTKDELLVTVGDDPEVHRARLNHDSSSKVKLWED